jgi:hypothetical protein
MAGNLVLGVQGLEAYEEGCGDDSRREDVKYDFTTKTSAGYGDDV